MCTARATLVPSTNTCSTARCSLSAATITTESSGMTLLTSPTDSLLRKPSGALTVRRSGSRFRRYLLPLRRLLADRTGPCPGKAADASAAGGCAVGSILCTVHNTISSVLLFCATLALEKIAQNRDVPESRNLVQMSVTRLSIRPAITKLWPSCSSNSVSALRVLSAGTVKPEIVKALVKSSVLTSGATFR